MTGIGSIRDAEPIVSKRRVAAPGKARFVRAA